MYTHTHTCIQPVTCAFQQAKDNAQTKGGAKAKGAKDPQVAAAEAKAQAARWARARGLTSMFVCCFLLFTHSLIRLIQFVHTLSP